MKVVLVLLLSIATVLCSPPHPCICWPGWNPVPDGDDYICKDSTRSEKFFRCNIDKPPICTCFKNGTPERLPLGEVNCVGGSNANKYDTTSCETSTDWKAWLSKYPEYDLHH